MIDGCSLLKLHRAKKEITILAVLRHVGSLLCVFLAVVLSHARFTNRIENNFVSNRVRAVGNFGRGIAHSTRSSPVEFKAVVIRDESR